MKMFVQMPKP